jgi:hypothetical protein
MATSSKAAFEYVLGCALPTEFIKLKLIKRVSVPFRARTPSSRKVQCRWLPVANANPYSGGLTIDNDVHGLLLCCHKEKSVVWSDEKYTAVEHFGLI